MKYVKNIDNAKKQPKDNEKKSSDASKQLL